MILPSLVTASDDFGKHTRITGRCRFSSPRHSARLQMRLVIMCLRRPRGLDTVRLRNTSASISFRGYSIAPTSLASFPHRTTRTPPFAKRKHSSARYFSTSLATAFVAKTASDSVPTNLSRMSEESKFYTFKPELPGDKTYDFEQLRGKVVLVVNVASKWFVQVVVPIFHMLIVVTQRFYASVQG